MIRYVLVALVIVNVGLANAEEVVRVGFGSCFKQDRPAPIVNAINHQSFARFVLLGDNMYVAADTRQQIVDAYRQLAAHPDFAALRSRQRLRAVWDDNDYGAKDGGADYPLREESRIELLRFFEPADSPRHSMPGVYYSEILGKKPIRVQLVLLDTRSFRGPLRKRLLPSIGGGPYLPHESNEPELLGAEQWMWFEAQLREPAEARIIVSSIQVISAEHGYETWGNFPKQRARLLSTLKAVKEPVLIVSGDRHHGELSKVDGVFELTTSSLNVPRGSVSEPNKFRIGEPYFAVNYGSIEVAIERDAAMIRATLYNQDGVAVITQRVPAS